MSDATLTRRRILDALLATAGGASLLSASGCGTSGDSRAGNNEAASYADEEYVWVCPNANLPLFAAHDHPALWVAAKELGVKVRIAGPNNDHVRESIDAIEQTAVRRPAGMMVVGWYPEEMIEPINKAVDNGIPVVCVDADVPKSKRLAFVGTDWTEIGIRQAEAMVAALAGRKGEVAILGLIRQTIDKQAFAGFRSVAESAGLTVLEPQEDFGRQTEATQVAAGMIVGHPKLVGMAGFDSESGPGIGQAVKEARKAGQVVVTCVDAEPQHLQLVKEGVVTAAVGQKRELFTYLGVKALFEVNRARVKFTADDKKAGIPPIAVRYDTGTYTVTKDNVELFIKSASA